MLLSILVTVLKSGDSKELMLFISICLSKLATNYLYTSLQLAVHLASNRSLSIQLAIHLICWTTFEGIYLATNL